MITPRRIAALLLTLALGAAPALAQPAAPAEKSAAPDKAAAAPTAQKAQTTPAQPQPTTREPAPQQAAPPTAGGKSPFDYRSSEQISEDVSVSFPVDI
ncbi:MAG: hypothetical protein R3E50_07675 [Halioglobus sp.]